MSRSVVTSRSFFSSSWIFAACPVTRPWPGKTSGAGFEESCSRQRCTRLRAMPRCADTSVKLLPSSTTKRTASFLNCGVNVRRSRVVPFAMDHLRALHGSYLGVHFSGQLHSGGSTDQSGLPKYPGSVAQRDRRLVPETPGEGKEANAGEFVRSCRARRT